MTNKAPRFWSAALLSCKVMLPLVFAILTVLSFSQIRDLFTAIWFVVVTLPLGFSAAFLFVVAGQLRETEGGLLYRKWANWQFVASNNIVRVERAFPFFGRAVLVGGARLYFIPESVNRSLIGNWAGNAKSVCAVPSVNSSFPVVWIFLSGTAGVLVGIVAFVVPTLAEARNGPGLFSTRIVGFEHHYFWIFIVAGAIKLVLAIIQNRKDAMDFKIASFLAGFGATSLLIRLQ